MSDGRSTILMPREGSPVCSGCAACASWTCGVGVCGIAATISLVFALFSVGSGCGMWARMTAVPRVTQNKIVVIANPTERWRIWNVRRA